MDRGAIYFSVTVTFCSPDRTSRSGSYIVPNEAGNAVNDTAVPSRARPGISNRAPPERARRADA